MNNLENIAKKHFEQYSVKETGVQHNWYHLPHKRRVEWMREILEVYSYTIKDLQSRIKLESVPGRMNTTYAMGRVEGVNAERLRFIQELTNLRASLEAELEDYEYFEQQRSLQQKRGDNNV